MDHSIILLCSRQTKTIKTIVLVHRLVDTSHNSSSATMSSVAGLQNIAPVPTSAEFIDVVLNATMRKTPTVIHKNVSPTLPPPV